jgi:hypothetical protein
VLLVPAEWSSDNTILLAWDMNIGTGDQRPDLYRIDVRSHEVIPLQGRSLALGTRLVWPVSALDVTLAFQYGMLRTVHLTDDSLTMPIPEQMPWPQSLDWAPNGAWMAYAVAGAAEGHGIYLYAPQEAELRPVKLPGGATEKAAFWAGAEHLFVVRQPQNTLISELWMVSLTTNEAPLRIMTHVNLPRTGDYNGWPWQDVLAMQVIPIN